MALHPASDTSEIPDSEPQRPIDLINLSRQTQPPTKLCACEDIFEHMWIPVRGKYSDSAKPRKNRESDEATGCPRCSGNDSAKTGGEQGLVHSKECFIKPHNKGENLPTRPMFTYC